MRSIGVGLVSLLISLASQAAIVIGQSAPLSGVAGEYGRQVAQGARAYFLWLNEHAGGINGEPVKHLLYDDGFDSARTLANTRTLIDDDQAVALMGYFGADATHQLLQRKWLEQAGIPLVGVANGARTVREPGSSFLFHTRAGQREEVSKLIAQMKGLGLAEIGVFHADDSFGQDGLRAAEQAAKAAGVRIVASASYASNSANVSAAVAKLAAANPPAILMISITKPSGAFIKAYRGQGGSAALYHTSTLDFDQLVDEIGAPLAHGLAIAQVYPYPWDSQSKLIREFRTAVSNYASTSTPMSYAALEGYIMAKLLAEAISRAGPKPSRAKVYQALASLGETNYGGFRLDYGPGRRVGSRFVELTIINQKGELSR